MSGQIAKAAGFRLANLEQGEKSCEYCIGIEDGHHYCLVLGEQLKNADIMRCDYFEDSPTP